MKEKEELHAISARILESDFQEIDRIATRRKMSQAHVIRMLVGVGIECHNDMEKLGLIGVVDFVYFVKEALKNQGKGRQLNLPI